MLRTPLVVGALVVLGAAVALVVILANRGDDHPATPGTDAQAQKPVTPPTLPEHNPSVTVTDRPRGETPAPQLPTGGENPREYAVGDSPVRDHRAGDHKPLDVPPNVHAPGDRMIPSTLTHDISQKVKAVMKECVKDLPRGSGKPRMEGTINVAIKNKAMSVTQATVQMREVGEGAAVDAVKQCVESHAVGLSTAAADQADLDTYSIHLSFAITGQ